MTSDRLVAGLDIGTATTTALIGEVVGDLPRHPVFKVLGVGHARTTGLRRGVVADIEETARAIVKAMTDAEQMSGARMADVYVGISGEHVQTMTSKGIAAVSGAEITRADVERVNSVARAQAIPPDRELLHAIPQEYSVDRAQGVRDPVGMVGTRLETEMYLVTVGGAPALNLRKAVERAGCRVRELVLGPLASALCVLDEDEKELGVALVEMGAGTTDVAIFHEGKIRHVATLGFGGHNVTSDIVHGLGVTQADAERLKERAGVAYEPLVTPGEVLALPGSGTHAERHVPRELLAHIIHQRLDEIFALVQREIERAGFNGRLSGGVVLTGGTALMPGVAELAAEVFGTGVRVAVPRARLTGLQDAVETPRHATVVGLAQYGTARLAIGATATATRRVKSAGPGVDKLAGRVKTWLQDFF